MQAHATYEEAAAQIEPGATLVCYTDGLVERRDEPIGRGLGRLAAAAGDGPDGAEALCDRLVAEVAAVDHTDDIAVVVVQLDAGPPVRIRAHLPATFDQLAPLRRRLGTWLTVLGADVDEQYTIVLGACEAATNAIEHAYGPADATFELDASVHGDEVQLSIQDHGRWREPRGIDRGRGLMLMEALMDRLEVERTPQGTTVRMVKRIAGR